MHVLSSARPGLQAIAKQIGIIDEDKYAQGKAIVVKGERRHRGTKGSPDLHGSSCKQTQVWAAHRWVVKLVAGMGGRVRPRC